MSDDSVFTMFDSWEPLFKARKAKGLDKWSRLQNIAEKLQGKDVRAISYTCSHPSHGGEGVRHLLGSVEGNLHFMLGYGNPNFHLAAYHWQIIDPNTTDEEAEETFERMHHPANPVLWDRSEVSAGPEGDEAEGRPHPLATAAKKKASADATRQATSLKGKSPTGSYMCVPDEGLVYGDHNGHVYRWELVQDTFFSAFNPEVTEAMNAAAIQKSAQSVTFTAATPDAVSSLAKSQRGQEFVDTVWPLVRSRCPGPGTVLSLESATAETVHGVFTPSSVDFFDRSGNPAQVTLFDRTYKSFDLTQDGNVPPASLLRFISKYFRIDASLLQEAATAPAHVESVGKSVEYGEPSAGFDLCPADLASFETLSKSTTVTDGTVRLVIS